MPDPPSERANILQGETAGRSDPLRESTGKLPKQPARVKSKRESLEKAAVNLTVLALVFFAVLSGVIGWLLFPQSDPPRRPPTILFTVLMPGDQKIATPATAHVGLIRESPDDGAAAVFYAIEGTDLDRAGAFHVVVDVPPGERENYEGFTDIPAAPYCDIVRCFGLERGWHRHVYLADTNFHGQSRHITFEWADRSQIISGEHGNLAFTVPGTILANERTFDPSNLSASDPGAGLQVESRFGPLIDDVVDSGQVPNGKPSPSFWFWDSDRPLGSFGVAVNASHSVSEQASEHRHEFGAGVALGLAGAAVIAAAQELSNRYAKERKDSPE